MKPISVVPRTWEIVVLMVGMTAAFTFMLIGALVVLRELWGLIHA